MCVCVCGRQVESDIDASELRLSNTTGRLVQLEREVGLLRQSNREAEQLADRAEWMTNEAKKNADEAQQVSADALRSLIQRFGKSGSPANPPPRPSETNRFSSFLSPACRSLTWK